MSTDEIHDPDLERLRNLPLRAEEIGFSRDEMAACEDCGKANAPTRAACLYCGAPIRGAAVEKLDLRQLESWENGFNVVLVDARDVDLERDAGKIASLLRSDKKLVTAILANADAVPVARVESEAAAIAVSEKLAELGIITTVVADDALQPNTPPRRLRSITFEGGRLELGLFNGDEVVTLPRGDLALIVPGLILEARTESIERRKRGAAKTIRETETSSDEPVIDIYSTADPAGWRIHATGFDFSCLGTDKSLLTRANMKSLTSKLQHFSPGAKLVDNYASVRASLELVWPSESRRDTAQVAVGRKDFAKVFTSNNAVQFTRYSRLQWRLYEKKV